MNLHKCLLLACSVIFLSACTVSLGDQVKNSNEEITSDRSGYQADFPTISTGDVEITSSLKDDLQRGELILSLHLKNDGDETIRIDQTNCGLSIDAERVAIPEIQGTFKSALAPGEEEHYQMYYYPINTVDFYFRSDYRGDMKQQYSLKFDFIADDEGNPVTNKAVTFKLADSAYQSYLLQYARERHMQIFDFDFDGETFASKQVAHLKKLLALNPAQPEHVVLAITPSITMDQVIINTYGYQYKDTLTVNMRMLNQGSQNLKVSLSDANIKVMGNTVSAIGHFSDSFDNGRLPDSTFIFKPGTRLHLLLKYHVPLKVDRWELSDQLLKVHNTNVKSEQWHPLFYRGLPFKESAITKDIL